MTTGIAGIAAIGHYLGIFPADGGRWCHEVRRGAGIEQLTEAEARAWSAPGAPTHEPSTLDTLVDRGLLVPVSSDDAGGFARAHRLVPLMSGLGPDPGDPDRCHLGAFGRPVVTVDRIDYDLWVEASGQPSLWAACRATADPPAALRALLDRLDPLICAGAACLDLAIPEQP
jgi:hypothetical protein